MMDKTININIAGTLFQIDEDAFKILKDYLQAVNNRFRNVQGGHETIEDIESRIAEIFQSQKGLAGAITKDNVEAMISIIGKPEDFDQDGPEAEPPVYSNQRKRMYRNPDDSIISGVCGGIGAYLNIDPVLFRILFVLFTAFFGTGFFIYIVLWIALPVANTDSRKREMYGNDYHSSMSVRRKIDGADLTGAPLYNTGYNNTSRVGNAFNEVFRAIGRVCYIILRIFLIIFGVIFVLAGFLAILSFVMIFVFKFPGVFSHDGINVHLAYYTDFLTYIVSPSSAPWIIALALIALALPMLALIYWGIKMIFWFKARDGVFSLVGLVLWVLSITALAMLLFNEGISFAETGRSQSQLIFEEKPDTIFIMTDHKAADLQYDKEFSLPDEDYSIYMSDSTRQLFLPVRMRLNIDDNNMAKVEIRKRSSGRTRIEAVSKAESIIYNSRMSNDTIWLDEYFTLPAGSKWTADFLSINLYAPENTILFFDKYSEKLFHNEIMIRKVSGDSVTEVRYDYDTEPWELGNKYWIFSENGLKEAEPVLPGQK
jgi:phage shock protein PspC (stress-responsive transcriptional regulator)